MQSPAAGETLEPELDIAEDLAEIIIEVENLLLKRLGSLFRKDGIKGEALERQDTETSRENGGHSKESLFSAQRSLSKQSAGVWTSEPLEPPGVSPRRAFVLGTSPVAPSEPESPRSAPEMTLDDTMPSRQGGMGMTGSYARSKEPPWDTVYFVHPTSSKVHFQKSTNGNDDCSNSGVNIPSAEDIIQEEIVRTGRKRRSVVEKMKVFKTIGTDFVTSEERSTVLQRVTKSMQFDTFISALILLNCLTLGIQAHETVVGGTSKSVEIFLEVLEQMFNLIFTLEIVVRWIAFGRHAFWPETEEGRSNLFDLFLVVFTCVLVSWFLPLVILIADVDPGASSKWLHTLKVCRVVRLGRLIRVFQRLPMFREAWKLFRGLSDSMRTLFWTVVVIVFVTYSFAVLGLFLLVEPLRATRRDAISKADVETLDFLLHLFGGLDKMMYTLIQILTGDSFHAFMRPVLQYLWWSWMYFYAYIAVACIVLMNLVTAVIVENAMTASANDRDHQVKESETRRGRELKHLERLFQAMDTDGGGTLSLEEFTNSFTDAEIRKAWVLLDFHPQDCKELFSLLDDGSGEIRAADFFEGLRRMKGTASAKDIFRVQKNILAIGEMLRLLVDNGAMVPSSTFGKPT